MASAAATQTGLPPNVEACAPGGQSITWIRAIVAESGMPGRDALGDAHDVGLQSGVIASPPFSGASHAALHFVGDEKNAVAAADALQFLQKFRRRRNVSAFALNRFDDDCGDFRGSTMLLKSSRSINWRALRAAGFRRTCRMGSDRDSA